MWRFSDHFVEFRRNSSKYRDARFIQIRQYYKNIAYIEKFQFWGKFFVESSIAKYILCQTSGMHEMMRFLTLILFIIIRFRLICYSSRCYQDCFHSLRIALTGSSSEATGRCTNFIVVRLTFWLLFEFEFSRKSKVKAIFQLKKESYQINPRRQPQRIGFCHNFECQY